MRIFIIMATVLVVAGSSQADVYEVPLFLRAERGDDATQKSVLRLQGAYPKEMARQRIQIVGYDDTGAVHGPVWLTMENFGDLTLTSSDLEQGNAAKGLPFGLGMGEGDWRLILTADDAHLDVRAYAHDITSGRLVPLHSLEAAHDVAPGRPWPVHIVSLLTREQNSLVRIFNRKDHPVRVELQARTAGAYAWCDLPPYATLVKTAAEVADLIDDEFSWDFLGSEWSVIVRVLAEPADPSDGLYCENGSASESSAPGAVTDIGVLTLMEAWTVP